MSSMSLGAIGGSHEDFVLSFGLLGVGFVSLKWYSMRIWRLKSTRLLLYSSSCGAFVLNMNLSPACRTSVCSMVRLWRCVLKLWMGVSCVSCSSL